MKRIISLLFVCFMCFALMVPCLAADFENLPITDTAEYLNEGQLEELSEKLEGVRQKHNVDVAIVTESEMSGYDAISSADDIYDECSYGAGKADDGIMLYICSEPRKFHITTHGKAVKIFNEKDIERMTKSISSHLKDDDYYHAMLSFSNISDEILERGVEKNIFLIVGCGLIIPLIIAFILMQIKLSKMKTAVKNDYAANYIKPGSTQLDVSRDIFLYSRVIKTEKPKNNSGSHKSSSGRTHGGGGGSF